MNTEIMFLTLAGGKVVENYIHIGPDSPTGSGWSVVRVDSMAVAFRQRPAMTEAPAVSLPTSRIERFSFN